MKVKILDIELIRRFGGAIIDMQENLAIRYEEQGKVKILNKELGKHEFIGNETVLVFSDENKNKEITDKNKRVPGPDDPIFPQIKV